MFRNSSAIVLFFLFFTSCSSSKKSNGEQEVTKTVSNANTQIIHKNDSIILIDPLPKICPTINANGPSVLIYKTKRDYSKNIPLTLSDDKKSIVNYPAPTDIFYDGKLACPLLLADGFLLDKRGISLNTAFTKYTYDEYSKLKTAPSITQLFDAIIDFDPIVVMYNCGSRYSFKNEVEELNTIINSGKLVTFKKLK